SATRTTTSVRRWWWPGGSATLPGAGRSWPARSSPGSSPPGVPSVSGRSVRWSSRGWPNRCPPWRWPGRRRRSAPIVAEAEPGWTLRGETTAVDAARFQALTAEARLLLAGGDPAAAAQSWRTALGLWRGAALVDVVDAGYLAAEATRLDVARLDAVEDLADA